MTSLQGKVCSSAEAPHWYSSVWNRRDFADEWTFPVGFVRKSSNAKRGLQKFIVTARSRSLLIAMLRLPWLTHVMTSRRFLSLLPSWQAPSCIVSGYIAPCVHVRPQQSIAASLSCRLPYFECAAFRSLLCLIHTRHSVHIQLLVNLACALSRNVLNCRTLSRRTDSIDLFNLYLRTARFHATSCRTLWLILISEDTKFFASPLCAHALAHPQRSSWQRRTMRRLEYSDRSMAATSCHLEIEVTALLGASAAPVAARLPCLLR